LNIERSLSHGALPVVRPHRLVKKAELKTISLEKSLIRNGLKQDRNSGLFIAA